MTRLGFAFDPSRCFGCHGCTAACVNVNATPPGLFWRHVHPLPPEPGTSTTTYLSMSCNHCNGAPCAAGCPAEALVKRPDGLVLHDAERCLGCRYCEMACPYGAIQWDEARQVVSKCHLCAPRLDAGREPACVATCFAGALALVDLDVPGAPEPVPHPGLPLLPGVGPNLRLTRIQP